MGLIRHYYKRVLLSILAALMVGCQSLPSSSLQAITIKYPQSDRLDFTGRGSAAAMMMSGSMGAMGIAIGVAIDEGLSKDLTGSARSGGFNVEQSFIKALNLSGYRAVDAGELENALVIEKLGFRAKGDLIAPWVELTFTNNGSARVCGYETFIGENVLKADLGELKKDGVRAAAMLESAIQFTTQNCLK